MKNFKFTDHTENKKQGAARNSGIAVALGKYIVFMDSDDFFRLGALETLLSGAQDEADVVVSKFLKSFMTLITPQLRLSGVQPIAP